MRTLDDIRSECIQLALHSEMIRYSVNKMHSIYLYLDELVERLVTDYKEKDYFIQEYTLTL